MRKESNWKVSEYVVSIDYLLLCAICNDLLELIEFYGWLVMSIAYNFISVLSIFIYVVCICLTTCIMTSWLWHNLHCDLICNSTCLPQTHTTSLLRTSIQMFKQGLTCPCSAISTVPGEDDHRARNGRAEATCEALETLSWDSVYKAPWCSEKNNWTASWGGTWWGRRAIERSLSM